MTTPAISVPIACRSCRAGGKASEIADDCAELALAAVTGEDAEEVGSDRVELQLRRKRGESLPGLFPPDQRARDELRKVLRFGQSRPQRVEATADRVDLTLIACKVE